MMGDILKWAEKVLESAPLLLWMVLLIAGLFHIFATIVRRSPRPPRHPTRAGSQLQFVISGQPRRGPLGLQKSEIEVLPTFVYSKGSRCKEGLDYYCAVCLSDFEEQEEGRSLPKCSHSFHAPCIDMWFITNSTCPLCRIEVGCNETKLPIANYCDDQLGSASAAAVVQIIASDSDQPQELASSAVAAASYPNPRL